MKKAKSKSRTIPEKTKRELWVKAGGRCEFGGCNVYLLNEPQSQAPGNFGELAHNEPFSVKGPRSHTRKLSHDIHDIENLMLLCQPHHKLIDAIPLEYPVEKLREFKGDHERRIFELTSISADRNTTIIRLIGEINGDSVGLSNEEARLVVARDEKYRPEFVARGTSDLEINLKNLTRDQYWADGFQRIDDFISAPLQAFNRTSPIKHISVFAFAKIPFIFYLGYKLGDKIPTSIYQRNRDSQDWHWHEDSSGIDFVFHKKTGNQSAIALIINASGEIHPASLPSEVSTFYQIQVSPEGAAPARNLVQARQTLVNFNNCVEKIIRGIEAELGSNQVLHVFPAVPVSFAFSLAQQFLKSMNHQFYLYDFNNGKFEFVKEIKK